MAVRRIDRAFARCRAEGRAAFVAYVTAGDPDAATSLDVVEALVGSGIDLLELGVPFSDPLADGEANQLAAARALSSGMTARGVLALAAEIRARHPELPLVLFTYLNPVAYGVGLDLAGYCREALAAGVDALLPLDLPPEEAARDAGGGETYRAAIDAAGMPVVTLVAPTTPDDRLSLLAGGATAFVYYVSREGVTGEAGGFRAEFAERITALRRHTSRPIVVGFGIATPEDVRAAAATGVDGVVVGSAIVRRVEALAAGRETAVGIGRFVAALTAALRA
jgi:tryptophan synthase alpha chain